MSDIALSTARLDPTTGLRRESPRPPALRNAAYADQFDWDTLFYDVYRVGRDVVLQGPPLLNLFAPLRAALPGAFRPLFAPARHIARDKRGEIWWRTPADHITLDGALGHHDLAVQPNLSHLFADRRVLHTLSRNNAPRWIIDWIAFYVAAHGADAVLLYDNGSTDYTAADLQTELRTAFPALTIHVVSWPFRYGPQGGLAGAVDGVEAPWDSDYCQSGSLQHARFRFLQTARSILNADIDELVLAPSGRSIFAAAEQSGFVKFPGRWISGASPHALDPATCRHADFALIDPADTRACPPKWCLVPTPSHPHRTSWSVHNLFGAPANRTVDPDFVFRHMQPINNNWKESRWHAGSHDPAQFTEDTDLRAAFDRTGLTRSTPDA